MWKLAPTCLPPRPERSSSSGVPSAPPAAITARRARTEKGRERPASATVHSTPTARPPSVTIVSTWTPARIRAPAATARGR